MSRSIGTAALIAALIAAGAAMAHDEPQRAGEAAGDAKRGSVAFRACVACHSLEQGVHLTGPREISSFVRARCDE
jgi:cytochrome c